MGERIAHKVDAAALPAGSQHLRSRCPDALVSIRDHQLDASQPAPPQLPQELGPERLGFGQVDCQWNGVAVLSISTQFAQFGPGQDLHLVLPERANPDDLESTVGVVAPWSPAPAAPPLIFLAVWRGVIAVVTAAIAQHLDDNQGLPRGIWSR
jgi:hypothetical protein